METITIQSVTPKKQGIGKTGKPWTISEVTDSTGRKFDTFDALAAGETVSVDIEPNPNPAYNSKIKKSGGSNNYTNTKNAEVSSKILEANQTKEERITMLSCLSTAASFYRERTTTEEGMIAFAEKLFKVAMKESNQLPF